ncbi:MAG: AAA family ATPase [Actinobacteria bacterium]|nr:AAA family ATPase [Actinomycetota bacterium]
MRPRSVDEVVGQSHLLGKGSPLRQLAEPTGSTGVSVILWGPAGTGKTTIAHVIARSSSRHFVELSAVTAGVKDVREVMESALSRISDGGSPTLLFLDEIHRFTKAQQDALLPGVENGWVTLVAATTENPSFSVITPLLSRSLLLTLRPLTDDDVAALVERAVDATEGLAKAVVVDAEALASLVRLSSGDARRALTTLEASANVVGAGGTITAETVAAASDRALLRYDRAGDEHYDVISAFIKSVRGSDVDSAIHYLARMIEAGEDPRFIARRLVILAAEDIGVADPSCLTIAVAAADAVQLIGMPEGRIPLAEATIHLALAPKSNAVITAIDTAIRDIRDGAFEPVPKHLRDAHYSGADKLGHGKGYVYPHDIDGGVAKQRYRDGNAPNYYEPSGHGREQELAERLARIRAILNAG